MSATSGTDRLPDFRDLSAQGATRPAAHTAPRHLAPQSFDAERREHLARIGFVNRPGRHVATETDRGAA